MHINHIDIPVPEVAATRDFFVRHLGFTHRQTRGRDGIAILHDDAGTVLTLSKSKAASAPKDGFHIGFHLETRTAVDRLYSELKENLVPVGDEPKSMRGAWLFYFEAPGSLLIEVACWTP